MSAEWVEIAEPVVHWSLAPCSGVVLIIEARPPYCDRGRYSLKVFVDDWPRPAWHVDAADGFPRYYFDLGVAKSEGIAFAECRMANERRESR